MTIRARIWAVVFVAGCGSSAVIGGSGGDDSGAPADPALGDAGADGDAAADDAQDADPSGVSYPTCVLPPGHVSYPCASTQSCVADCQSCPGTTNGCRVTAFGTSIIKTSCVAACDTSCAQPTSADAGIPLADTCGNTCTRLASDVTNCGVCGHKCPKTDLLCSDGHCCGDDGHGQPLQWNSGCAMCCTTKEFINLDQCAVSGCKPAD